ncbi:MAG: LysR family transcriptional regulator [Firmicutes bacterium]|nr:LysR family transcriptional regulator [Bacillota bacterium]
MNTYPWQVFLSIAENRSFQKTAASMNLSASAVSHMISKLEDSCGYPLFVRNRNNIELTTNEKILMPYVVNLLKCENALDQEILGLKETTSGIVRIAGINSAIRLWMPDILWRFNEKYPNIKVVVMQSGNESLREWIEKGVIDLALLDKEIIRTSPVREDSFMPMHKTPMVCLTPKDYVPLDGKVIKRDDLMSKPIIMQLEGYDYQAMEYLKEIGVSADSNFQVETDATCHTFVEHGFGFCVTSELAARCNPSDVNMYPLEKEMFVTIGLVTVYSSYMSPAARLLRKEVFDYMTETGLMNV